MDIFKHKQHLRQHFNLQNSILVQPLILELVYTNCKLTVLFSLEHTQFFCRFLFWQVKAQNSVETISLSDNISGDILQTSTEQKQQ